MIQDPDHPSAARIGVAAEARAVASDMTAIFGATAPAAAVSTPPARSRSRKPLAHIALAGVAVAVAAGMYLGRSTPTAPAIPPSARVQPAPKAEPQQVEEVGVYAVEALPPAVAGAPAPEVPTTAPRASTAGARNVEPDSTPPPVAPPPAVEAPPPIPRPEVAPVPVPDPPAASRSDACADDACLFDRVQAADRRLNNAFAQADAAGVRGRTLRLYEREWKRAYALAADRPQEALRLYAMITADIRNLTLEAEQGGVGER
jgi:hypothetical protein